MGEFFDNRLDIYDEHQLTCIENAADFYPYTASQLKGAKKVLDLGCGTGLELNELFRIAPDTAVTGIDLASGMLQTLKKKFPDKELTLILGSYFDVSFSEGVYDAAVSVESLHHFTQAEKLPLYKKLRLTLKEGGYFILTDYFAPSEKEETEYRREYLRLKKEQGLRDDEFYHYDTPLTTEHEIETLKEAGFSSIEILNHWVNTYTLRAQR